MQILEAMTVPKGTYITSVLVFSVYLLSSAEAIAGFPLLFL